VTAFERINRLTLRELTLTGLTLTGLTPQAQFEPALRGCATLSALPVF
jgi:hypothetical protein